MVIKEKNSPHDISSPTICIAAKFLPVIHMIKLFYHFYIYAIDRPYNTLGQVCDLDLFLLVNFIITISQKADKLRYMMRWPRHNYNR